MKKRRYAMILGRSQIKKSRYAMKKCGCAAKKEWYAVKNRRYPMKEGRTRRKVGSARRNLGGPRCKVALDATRLQLTQEVVEHRVFRWAYGMSGAEGVADRPVIRAGDGFHAG